MARSAKCSAVRLVRAENRPPGSASSGELPSQMYSDADLLTIRGPGGGHSARSPAGGLITAQSANDIVRDHRYTPSLLVRLNCRSCTLNQAAYAATGSAPASSAASTVTRPARRISSAASSTTSSTASSTSPTGQSRAETPSRKAAAAVAAGRRSPGDRSSRYRASKTRRPNGTSGTASASSWSSYASKSTGRVASVAAQAGSPKRRAIR